MHIGHSIAANGIKFLNFYLPCTKTKEKGKDINITNSTCQCSATTSFEHHLSSNQLIPDTAPLFAFKTGNGMWSLM